ncbi:MAG: hypothetical protein GX442_19125 [Candidatus Riflebacteria bacterium]|nr:hypothetical protein [Candidatus Riflebacteria bacterium]
MTAASLILATVALPLLGGILGRLLGFHSWLARWTAGLAGAAGGLAGLALAGELLWQGGRAAFEWPWFDTGYTLALAVDPLSAFFLLPISLLSAVTAVYGASYLGASHGGGHSPAAGSPHGADPVNPANVGLFAGFLQAGMALVLLAQDGLGFLVAWEVMSLAAFFIIALDDAQAENRAAAWIYLVASHIGAAFLLFFFLYLGMRAGDFSFEALAGLALSDRARRALTLAAVIGFGAKAGFVPLHVWLPDAHPAAPSHISALMSGAMTKTGIYGLLRALTLVGLPGRPAAAALIGLGLVSGILGIVMANAQRDLKRLLAYSTVENLGIVALGLGVGLWGAATGQTVVAVLGLAGALVHVLNHALAKGLLFLAAGVLVQATGTRQLDRLGGLLKRMPGVAGSALTGAVAIAGLPPLNGFLGEFLIFLAAFTGLVSRHGESTVPLTLAIMGLALIGGLAAACFARVFGIAFLGEPRTAEAAEAAPPEAPMALAMALLAVGCVVALLGVAWSLPVLGRVVTTVLRLNPLEIELELLKAGVLLRAVIAGGGLLVVLAGFLAVVRHQLLAGREVGETPTWDCGYAAPTPRMSYTGSSFAQPLNDLFGAVRGGGEERPRLAGLFPATARFASRPGDACVERFYEPVFRRVETFFQSWRWVQSGRVQAYVLYIALTLLFLLGWNLW